jgi:hypothetical protein
MLQLTEATRCIYSGILAANFISQVGDLVEIYCVDNW